MSAAFEIREKPRIPFVDVEWKPARDDDRDHCQTALTILADEFLQRYDQEAKNRDWVIVVGAYSNQR
jgi:hypothetical protein